MKVLHVGPKNYPPNHGGVEKSVYDITRNIISIKFYVFVEWKQKETDRVRVLPSGIIKQLKAIRNLIIKEQIDVIHFHKEGFIPHSLYFSIFNDQNCVHSIRGCAWRIKRWSWWIRISFYILDLLACMFVSKVVFVGKEDFCHFSRIVFWRKLYYIPNGVEINSIECLKDTSKCVYIGRISPEKNIIKLIEMFVNPNKTLTIFGPLDKHDEFYGNKVMEAIEKNSNVRYGGVLSYTDVIPTISKYNTLYNISFSEGMPISVLEAASVGLNLVLSNIPQHVDLNFPDVYYVDPYLPVDEAKFNGNSVKNIQYLEKNFSLEQTVINYITLYKQITKK